MIKLGVIALFFLLIFLMSCSQSEQTLRPFGYLGKSNPPHSDVVRVFKVVDGDTFWVKNGIGKNVKIRLIGIDAPEDRNAFRKRKHPFGITSKRYLDSLILHKEIRLEYDVDSLDRYGRTLAYAYLKKIFINANMIQQGYAVLMTIAPNIRYESQFVVLQKYARENRLGLWNLDDKPIFE